VNPPRVVEVAVVGAGPAGLSAALSAARLGAQVVVLDRETRPGGQLIKQTHMFFGSRNQYAATRGIDIARLLSDQLAAVGAGASAGAPAAPVPSGAPTAGVELLLNATVLGRYPDGVVTVEHEDRYLKFKPQRLIVATGAAEKLLPFPNNDLPGIYGAGAVQTLMNVHGVRPGARVVMVGAGNIGLIVSYQLLQAQVEVVAILDAAPTIGGYLVHASKVRRAGVPILTSHTVVEAYGDPSVEGVVIEALDERWQPMAGTRRELPCDVVCLAVGLTPLTELLFEAQCEMRYIAELGGLVPVRNDDLETTVPGIYVAGDVAGIEEASAAMVEGRLAGVCAAASLGHGGAAAEAVRAEALAELYELRCGPAGQKIRDGLCRLAG
jgi:sarcosine oxidase subunit alpha